MTISAENQSDTEQAAHDATDASTQTQEAQTPGEDQGSAFISSGEVENAFSSLDDDTRGMIESLMEKPAPENEGGTEEKAKAASSEPEAGKESQPVSQKAPDDEVADILAEVKSERGQNRVRGLIDEKNQYKQERDHIAGDLGAIQEVFHGLEGRQIAEGVEFYRLIESENPNDLKVALEMLDDKREYISRRLGQPVPGVDLLRERPDLKQRVLEGDILQQDAERIAALEAGQQERMRLQQQQSQQVAQQQAQAQQSQHLANSINATFQPFENNADFPARRDMLLNFLSQGNNLAMVKSMNPAFVPQYLLDKYNSFAIQPQAKPAQQPLRSRPMRQGAQSMDNMSPEDVLRHEMQNMGLLR